jgi:transporter family protein
MGWIALLFRIILLGLERIFVKRLGTGSSSISGAFLFFFIPSLFLLVWNVIFETNFPYAQIPGCFALSFVYALAFVLYVYALGNSDASLVSPLYNFSGVFLLFTTWLVLDEQLTPYKIAGVLLMVGGASMLNRGPVGSSILSSVKNLIKDPGCRAMLASAAFIAIGRTCDGWFMRHVTPVQYITMIYTGISLWLGIWVILTGRIRNAVGLFYSRKFDSMMAGIVNLSAYLCLLYAFKSIPVSIAEPLSILSMVVTFLMAYFLFKEKVSERIPGSLLILAGAGLLSFI